APRGALEGEARRGRADARGGNAIDVAAHVHGVAAALVRDLAQDGGARVDAPVVLARVHAGAADAGPQRERGRPAQEVRGEARRGRAIEAHRGGGAADDVVLQEDGRAAAQRDGAVGGGEDEARERAARG